MQQLSSTNEGVCVRLVMLVDELSGSNARKFAEDAGVNAKTFHTNLKGRPPSVETLVSICRRYRVSLNWLAAGIGHPYLTDQVQEKKVPSDCFQEVAELQEWLAEISEEDPDRRTWFKMELKDNFPLFKEWLKKRDQTNAEASERQAA